MFWLWITEGKRHYCWGMDRGIQSLTTTWGQGAAATSKQSLPFRNDPVTHLCEY